MPDKEKLIEIKDLQITFGSGRKKFVAVDHVNIDIYKGETFSLVGESGSGKTTIGRAITRINPVSAGEILFKGQRISGKISKELDREVIQKCQMIFQDPMASLNERAKVDYIVSEGLYNFHLYKDENDRKAKVEMALREVGLLPEFASRFPHEFSGGQRQRIGIARALIMEPEFVVADEPISALDVSIRAQVLNLLNRLRKSRGLTYLFIAHDLSVVRFISDRIGVIYKGRIVEVAEAEELFNFPLHPYTHSLISAIPIPDPQLEKNKVQYIYDPAIHDYSTDKPEFVDIGHDHWIYGNKEEIEKYKALREKGEPVKAVNIISPEETEKFAKARKTTEEAQAKKVAKDLEEFLQAPPRDTGSIWYTLVSFFLPILGLIGGAVFKHFHYKRNAKSCFKGAIRGFIVLGVILALFLLLLILAVI